MEEKWYKIDDIYLEVTEWEEGLLNVVRLYHSRDDDDIVQVSFPMQGKGEIWANPCPLDIVSPEFVRNAFGLAIRILESGSLSFFDNYEALEEYDYDE